MRWTRATPLLLALAAAPLAAAPSTKEAPATAKKVLPFIEDDWPKALADAKAKSVPIFIEAWAPW
jgi:hypothetical protein